MSERTDAGLDDYAPDDPMAGKHFNPATGQYELDRDNSTNFNVTQPDITGADPATQAGAEEYMRKKREEEARAAAASAAAAEQWRLQHGTNRPDQGAPPPGYLTAGTDQMGGKPPGMGGTIMPRFGVTQAPDLFHKRPQPKAPPPPRIAQGNIQSGMAAPQVGMGGSTLINPYAPIGAERNRASMPPPQFKPGLGGGQGSGGPSLGMGQTLIGKGR